MPRPTPAAKPKHAKKTLKNLLKSLKHWSPIIIISIILAALSAVLTIFGPKLLGEITTTATTSLLTTGEIDWQPLITIAWTLIALYFASSLFGYLQYYLLGRVTALYTKKLRTRLLEKISRLPVSYFDQHKFGDTLSLMSNDIDIIANSLSNSLSQIITSVTTFLGILIMMLTISPLLTLIALAAIAIALLLTGKVTTHSQRFFLKQQNTLGALNNTIEEDYAGQLIIKSNSHAPASIKNFEKTNQALYEAAWRANFFSSLPVPITHVFTNLGYVGVCIAGGYAMLNGQIAIGDLQAFIQYVNQFNRPVTEIAQIATTIQLTLAAAERVFNFLDQPEEAPDPLDAKPLKSVQGAVEFKNINFAYDPKKPIIKNFSIKIQPGQNIAIVGPTGAGKTTLINLLMRFYDPTTGEITIDETPTKEMARADVRALFGMVLQDTWLFSGTVAENLRYGDQTATRSDLVAAAKSAHIHHVIEALPNGYETKISEDSDNISAGEKQLLTIARAMVADPPMMILDEATSSVDTRTEQQIQDALEKLTNGRTSFVIAHRLSTIKNADQILVLKDGNIVEHGTHTSLLAGNGFYAELYNSQFAE